MTITVATTWIGGDRKYLPSVMNHPLYLRLLLCFVTFEFTTAQCPVMSLPSGWTEINVPGSPYCYALSSHMKVDAASARAKCWSIFRGFLARFHDVAALRSLAKNIQINTDKVWIDLVRKQNGNWIWSDGTTVDSRVLNAKHVDNSEIDGASLCGALTNDATPKFSKWTREIRTAKHEFLCQALKVGEDYNECGNNSFSVGEKCFAISSEPSKFESAVATCKDEHKGILAGLVDTELATATANYFHKMSVVTNIKVWLDVVWSEDNKRWQHLNGKKVTIYEENWSSSFEKIYSNPKSSVVLDLQDGLKWKARKPGMKAHFVCEIKEVKKIQGKAVGSPSWTTVEKELAKKEDDFTSGATTALVTTTSIGLIMDIKTLGLIGGAIGVVFCILLVIICLLCYKKKKGCCAEKKEVQHTHSDGFGTPVSFDFVNPDYGRVTVTSGQHDTPTRELPLLPGQDDTYATIDDALATPVSTVDLASDPPVATYNTLSLARSVALSHSRVSDNRSASSLPRTHYASLYGSQASVPSGSTLPTPANQMTSFGTPASRGSANSLIVVDTPNLKSPCYTEMNRNEDEQSALQYAELAFGERDEDQQFDVESCYVKNGDTMNQHKHHYGNSETMTHENQGVSEGMIQRNPHGSITQQRFFKQYPELTNPRNARAYENEHSPLILSPDSPQFPLHT